MSHLIKNINYLLTKHKTNPNDLEEKNPDIKQSTFFRILNGITKDPRRSTLEPFAKWANVSVNDLFDVDLEKAESLGTTDNQSQRLGDMTQSQSSQSVSEPQLFTQIDKNFKIAHIRFSKPDGSRPTVKIPVYRDVKAACGDGFENFLEDPSDYIEMEPMVLKMLGIECKPEHLKVIYSVEDSMWPTVPHDKPLFLDVSDRDPNAIKSGKIYVFTYAYGCRMKRIFMGYNEDENKRNIRLASDNPDKNEYPDEWITKEQLNEINFIGRLVWTGKEL